MHPTVWPQQKWAENWGGELGPHLAQCGLDQGPTPSAALIHSAVWPQWTWAENWGRGLGPLFGEGELGPHLTQCGQDRGLPACQVSS